jgi:nitroimidazol reductase NimA-like FMN-containing flavoprotein (pyridoxamine 5'-phosphate oxidase superfamily)
MLIHEMTEDECGAALAQVSFGRLACAHGGQPYIVPIYFAYDKESLRRHHARAKDPVDALQSAGLSGD